MFYHEHLKLNWINPTANSDHPIVSFQTNWSQGKVIVIATNNLKWHFMSAATISIEHLFLRIWLKICQDYFRRNNYVRMNSMVSGPCITNVIATCRKNFSQWESSFLWKLRCHWLKFLRRVAKTLVIQGPGTHCNGTQKNAQGGPYKKIQRNTRSYCCFDDTPGVIRDCIIEYNQWCHAFHSLGIHSITPLWSVKLAKLEARLFTTLLLNKKTIWSIRVMSQITYIRVYRTSYWQLMGRIAWWSLL